jgi:hypothetical protein
VINQPDYKYYVVDINKIYIDSGWEYRQDAIDRAAELAEEGGVPKVCNKSRVAVGNRVLDPDNDASWSPSRNAEPVTGVRGVQRNPEPRRYREAFEHAREAGRHAVGAYHAVRGQPRQNPHDDDFQLDEIVQFYTPSDTVSGDHKIVDIGADVVVVQRIMPNGEMVGRPKRVKKSDVLAPDEHLRQNPRLNPSPERESSRDEERGAKVFEMWHQKSPTGAQVKRVLGDMDACMVPVGKAHEIIYRSGKWEKGRKTNDYVHAFDSHPSVYMLEKFAPESRAQGKSAGSLLRAAQGADGRFVVAELATPLTLSIDDGQEIAIHNGSKVYGAVDKKTVIICDPKWKLVIIKGGRMHFDERGIVY